MGQIFAKQVPDEFVEVIDSWRKQQVPMLNRSQSITLIIKEWIDAHRKEFVKDGIITDEQLGLFNGK